MFVRPSFIVGVAAGIALSGALLLFRGSGVAPAYGTGANKGATAGTFVAQGAREVPTDVAQVPERVAQVTSSVNTADSGTNSTVPTPQLTPTPVIRVPGTPTPAPTPKASVTPTPKVTVPTSGTAPNLTPIPTPIPTPVPTPPPTPVPTATPAPTEAPYDGPVMTLVISEVAWAGTSATPNGEWLELYNGSDTELDMADYSLVWLKDDGEQVFLSFTGSVAPDSYFLIERTTEGSPDPIVDIQGDLQLNFGSFKLNNTGAYIVVVRLSDGEIVDAVDFDRENGAWYGGESVGRFSMERIRLDRPGTPDNWGTNDGITVNGTDADGSPIKGTPKSKNSLYVSG